jgi:4a-hydroxytetrahydrobiopterin dehydratase
MPSLTQQEIVSLLPSVPDWRIESEELTRTFSFGDFKASLKFVNKVGEMAEEAGHHPDIGIRYNRVRLALTTHDAGGLTQKDFDLATHISEVSQSIK